MNPSPSEDLVWATLAGILDPEFALNLVDLGLIYDVRCQDGAVHVVMTLTTPTCPSGHWIHQGVQTALAQLPGVTQVAVEMVFEPAWTTHRLSAEAKEMLRAGSGR